MSIKQKITLLFLMSLFLMLTLTFWIEKVNSEKNRNIIISKYMNLSKELLPIIADANENLLKRRLKELGLVIKEDKKVDKVLKSRDLTFGKIEIFQDGDDIYLLIKYLDEKYILYDKSLKDFLKQRFITNTLLSVDIFVLIIIYFIVLKILSPIRDISQKLKRFSNGEFDIKMDTKGDSEIKALAQSFNQMATCLKSSFEDREQLIKYIGHELRTPLAKIKFYLQKDDKDGIESSINQMDSLVNEILNMHLLDEKNLNKTKFKAETLISEALSKLLIKNESDLEVNFKEFFIEGDLNHLSIAVKNLIDNALKYSDKKPVKIVAINNKIEIESFGKKLKRELEYYIKPFNKDDDKKEGFGLGLSIVDRVVKKHRFKLRYRYESGKNIFTIIFTS